MTEARLRVLALMLTDAVTMAAVWAFDVWAYWAMGFGRYRYGWEFYLRLWPALVAFIVVNVAFRLYQGRMSYPAAPVSPVEEMRRLIASAFLTHVGVVAYIALTNQTMKETSRVVTVFSGVFTALLAQPMRDLARLAMSRFRAFRIPAAVVGPAPAAERLSEALAGDPYAGFRPVGESARPHVLFSCEEMDGFRAHYPGYAQRYSHIEYLPVAGALPLAGAKPISVDGRGGIEFASQRRMRLLQFEKSLLDKSLALLVFVCSLPLFVLIPLLVKLTSRGPVFYRHSRLGKRGRPLRVWKFRTMYADADRRLEAILASDPAKRAEWEANFKLADDPRVTPLGRFLRRTSLDEFPQLFNVFAGDMTLVGPRPIVEGEVHYYGDDYATFSSVKPGVTGLWQASGRSDTDYARRVALDIHYILNWSPWLDLWILKKTFAAVVFMRGAR
ncbi:MAG: sugar transferase [Kiritimatiellae bacterium]|nr:sugar transferase [Kiritimatiellia bacterium]